MVTGTEALGQDAPEIVQAVRHDTSIPLREMRAPVAAQSGRAPFAIPNKLTKFGRPAGNLVDKASDFVDPMLQTQAGTLAPTLGVSFDGSSDDDNSAILGFRVVPPDTDGDVGPNHYVQWINSVTEIFDRNGNTLLGPVAGNIYFQGMGGDCEADNDGDPVVLYDEAADRWLVSQFSVSASPYSMCIAISTTPDPTGSYNRYEFGFGTDFPDYPKLGIWGDSYTMTTRDFTNGASFGGQSAIVLDRTAMLAGNPATMVRFKNAFGITKDGYLSGDSDAPISGPVIFGGHGADGNTTIELWQLTIDWNNPGAATFASIPGVTVPAFDDIVPSANQPNGQVLDDLSNFTMHRLNVRDFGTHKSMVANHSVEVTTGVIGVRWYEFRNTGGNWTLYQSGTYSPDSDDRWMGSIAINANGDIALGYSRSSSTMFPSIYMTGQTADQSGTGVMNVAETLLHAGTGAQSGASRWGDYSMMSVDPTDNASFWYTTEYYAATGSFDFNTRITSFNLGGGGGTGNNPPVASFTTSCTDLVCNFTDTSSDSDGSIASRSWTFGDGGTSTAQNPSHTYAAAGTYTVGLTVTDNEGATGSTSQSVTVTGGGTGGPTVHISALTLGKQNAGGGNYFGKANVTVVNENGQTVGSATVTGVFSGPISETKSATTNNKGRATIISSSSFPKAQLSSLQFCVSNVVATGYTYDPNANGNPSWDCGGVAPIAGSFADAQDNLKLQSDLPVDFDLAQNYPNPFNPTTIIGYSVPEASDVTVQVFNMLGQEVATLASGYHNAGHYEVAFNANNLSAGIYIYTIKAGNVAITKRMTLLK
ncbi:MAG: PKD domain-containing protein [Rhodothermales bacterium]